MVRTDCQAVAGSAVYCLWRNPPDCGWHQDRLWSPTTDDCTGISQARHSDCLDMGQPCTRSQHWQQTISLAGLCQNADLARCSRFSGRRHRIWACKSAATTGKLALELCFAPKIIYFGMVTV